MDEQIVAFIFKIVNFLVFIGLGVYFFKKYALRKIITGIARKESFIRGLFDRQQELEQQQYALDQTIAKEEALCLALKKKVNLWKHHVGNELKKQEKEQEEQTQNVYMRLKKRMEMIVTSQIKKKAFQRAIDRSRFVLKQQFAQEKNADQFLTWTISWMSEDER
ncbi:MAG TPA: hypothetical protein ENI08_02710 [Candidatus Dependentiae bacterium]|nr:hypothetical protein [Candidatus Dependentiae bacterium]